jgi:hypothetical protein
MGKEKRREEKAKKAPKKNCRNASARLLGKWY